MSRIVITMVESLGVVVPTPVAITEKTLCNMCVDTLGFTGLALGQGSFPLGIDHILCLYSSEK